MELTKQVQNPAAGEAYPASLDTGARRALYDNLGHDAKLAMTLDQVIRETKKDSWRGNRIKEREVRYAIRRIVPDPDVDRIFELVRNQREY